MLRAWTTLLALAAAALACSPPPQPPIAPVLSAERVALNTSLPPIDVRYGIHANDVELAILLAVGRPSQPPVLDPGQEITGELLSAIVGARGKGAPWRFESRKPGLVFADYERGRVGMRVAIKFDDQLVMLRILDSRNLGQTEDHINAGALTLLAELQGRIQRSVIAVAQRNRYGAPIPADP
jgi:hypothetical protein